MVFRADFIELAIKSLAPDLDRGRWPRPDEPILHYAFHHPWQKLSDRERLMLNLLQPHLIQAYQNVCQDRQLHQQLEQLQQSLDRCGVILVDELGRVQLMTAQAATWVQFYFPGDRNSSQLPELLQSWVRYQIDRLKSVDDLLSPQLPL